MISAVSNELISLALGGFGGAALRRSDEKLGLTDIRSDEEQTGETKGHPQPVDSVEFSGDSQAVSHNDSQSSGDTELSPEEEKQVRELKQRDAEVRRHEQAHKAAAGSHASGGPTYEYQTGPDGKQYAVGGEVQIDTSPVQGNPQATIAKMQQIRRAALAPAEPSGQDRAVAAQAQAAEREARQELREEQQAESTGEGEDRAATVGIPGANESKQADNGLPGHSVSPGHERPVSGIDKGPSAIEGGVKNESEGENGSAPPYPAAESTISHNSRALAGYAADHRSLLDLVA